MAVTNAPAASTSTTMADVVGTTGLMTTAIRDAVRHG
jgi:hypothetical protein